MVLKLHGLVVPMVTPFKDNGDLDEGTLGRLTNWLIDEGVHGLYPVGACGEAPRLSFQEKKKIIDVVVEEANGRVPVLPLTVHESFRETIELTEYAKDTNADGAVIIPPNFWGYKISSEEILLEYFNTICEKVDIPVMVYDNGYPLSVKLVKKFTEINNIVALKDSANDFMKIVSEIAQVGEKIAIFPGEEHMFLPSLILGSKGMVGSGLNFLSTLMLDIYEKFQKDQIKEALVKHNSLVPLWDFIYGHDEHHVVKDALAMLGMPVGSPRKPYFDQPLSSEEKKELKDLLTLAGLINR